MTLKELHRYCATKANERPELSEDIFGFYDLAQLEVESGEPETQECYRAVADIEDLLSK